VAFEVLTELSVKVTYCLLVGTNVSEEIAPSFFRIEKILVT
jgi:hypothetical protein